MAWEMRGDSHTYTQTVLGSQNYHDASEASAEPSHQGSGFSFFPFSYCCLTSIYILYNARCEQVKIEGESWVHGVCAIVEA